MTNIAEDLTESIKDKFTSRTFFYFCFSWIFFNFEKLAYWCFSEDSYNRKLAWLAGLNFSWWDNFLSPLFLSVAAAIFFPIMASVLEFFTRSAESYFKVEHRIVEDKFRDKYLKRKISKTSELLSVQNELRDSLGESRGLIEANNNALLKAKTIQEDRLNLFATERNLLDDFQNYSESLSRVKSVVSNLRSLEYLCASFDSVVPDKYAFEQFNPSVQFIELELIKKGSGAIEIGCSINIVRKQLDFGHYRGKTTFSINTDLTQLRSMIMGQFLRPEDALTKEVIRAWHERVQSLPSSESEPEREYDVKCKEMYKHVYSERDVTDLLSSMKSNIQSALTSGTSINSQ
jgi:hypothetical protein